MADRLHIATVPVFASTIGLTLCPGREMWGLDGTAPRELGPDLDVVVEEGFRHVGMLLEDDELASFAPGLLDAYAERGIEVLRHAVPDVQVPTDLEAFRGFAEDLADWLRAGHKVLVHCRGGLGRSGLTAACVLTLDGRPPQLAIAEVRRARPKAVETRDQEDFVVAFGQAPGASCGLPRRGRVHLSGVLDMLTARGEDEEVFVDPATGEVRRFPVGAERGAAVDGCLRLPNAAELEFDLIRTDFVFAHVGEAEGAPLARAAAQGAEAFGAALAEADLRAEWSTWLREVLEDQILDWLQVHAVPYV